MSRTETISLHQLPSSDPDSNHGEQAAAEDAGHDGATLTPSADTRQAEASRKTAFVLLGASISQLPIWGESIPILVTGQLLQERNDCNHV